MSIIQSEWSGSVGYPDGSKISWRFNVDAVVNTVAFTADGTDDRGPFKFLAGLVTSVGGQTLVSATQHYAQWQGQYWAFRGTLSSDGHTITGNWYDSPQDTRKRVGTFVATRNTPVHPSPFSPLDGKYTGEYKYPDGSEKHFSITFPPSALSSRFTALGNDEGEFTVSGETNADVSEGRFAVQFQQTYNDEWKGQVWFWDGILSADGKELVGRWHDSSADSRGRNSTFVLRRA